MMGEKRKSLYQEWDWNEVWIQLNCLVHCSMVKGYHQDHTQVGNVGHTLPTESIRVLYILFSGITFILSQVR
jgi:hypothetical protein